MRRIPNWFITTSHVAVPAIFGTVALLHIVDRGFLRWEMVVLAGAASLPFLLPLLAVYVKGVGKDGVAFNSHTFSRDIEALPEAPADASAASEIASSSDWTSARAKEYARVDGYMLSHVYSRSQIEDQEFDVFVFLVRHQKGTSGPPRSRFTEIQKVEFFFGDSWDNQIFEVTNDGGMLGVRTEAWGTFLATCRIIFKDTQREPIVLHRYVDFHMLQRRKKKA